MKFKHRFLLGLIAAGLLSLGLGVNQADAQRWAGQRWVGRPVAGTYFYYGPYYQFGVPRTVVARPPVFVPPPARFVRPVPTFGGPMMWRGTTWGAPFYTGRGVYMSPMWW